MTADEKAALHVRVTDDAVGRIAEIVRTRENALRGIADVEAAAPVITETKARIDEIVAEATKILGKRKAVKLADQAQKLVKAEKEAAARAAPRPVPTGQVLESTVDTKATTDPRPLNCSESSR